MSDTKTIPVSLAGRVAEGVLPHHRVRQMNVNVSTRSEGRQRLAMWIAEFDTNDVLRLQTETSDYQFAHVIQPSPRAVQCSLLRRSLLPQDAGSPTTGTGSVLRPSQTAPSRSE